jgi:predicted DNA-binding transcriptional regulator AlpA
MTYKKKPSGKLFCQLFRYFIVVLFYSMNYSWLQLALDQRINKAMKGVIRMRPSLVKVNTAAKILGIKKGTLYNWISNPASKNPKYIKFGRSVFFDLKDLYQFIEDHKVSKTNNE